MHPNGESFKIVKAWPRAGQHGFWAVPLRRKGLQISWEWSPISPKPPCLTLVLGLPRKGTSLGHHNFRQYNSPEIKDGEKR